MTKGVSFSTTAPKDRDAARSATTPASRAGEDSDQVSSFAALLDTATPTRADEPDHKDRSDHVKPATDREQSHSHDRESNYFSPADLALSWLASRDLPPQTPEESSEAGETAGSAETSTSSESGTTATAQADSLASGVLVTAAETGSPRAIAEERTALGQPLLAVATRTPADVTAAGTELANDSTITPSWAVTQSSRSLARAVTALDGGSTANLIRPTAGNVPASFEQEAQPSAGSVPAPADSESPGPALVTSLERAAVAADHRDADRQTSSEGVDRTRARELAAPESKPDGEPRTSPAPSADASTVASPSATLTRSGEVGARSDASVESGAPEQANGNEFMAANTELTTTLSRAQHGTDGSYRVTALLNPPALGRVEATIKVDGQSIEVAITSHTTEGHDALANHLDELQRELGSDHVEVHLSLSDGGGQAKDGDAQNHERTSAAPLDEGDANFTSHAAPADSSLHIVL